MASSGYTARHGGGACTFLCLSNRFPNPGWTCATLGDCWPISLSMMMVLVDEALADDYSWAWVVATRLEAGARVECKVARVRLGGRRQHLITLCTR